MKMCKVAYCLRQFLRERRELNQKFNQENSLAPLPTVRFIYIQMIALNLPEVIIVLPKRFSCFLVHIGHDIYTLQFKLHNL